MSMRCLLALLLLATSICAQLPERRALRVGTLHVGDGTVLSPATILISQGRIEAVGQDLEVPAGVELEDRSDCVATPGFVDIACELGIESGRSGNDESSEVTPDVRAAGLVDLAARDLRDAFRAGVTSAVVHPGDRNVIGGRPALLKTGAEGARLLQGTPGLRCTLTLEAAAGNQRGQNSTLFPRRPGSRMGVVYELRRALAAASEAPSVTDGGSGNGHGPGEGNGLGAALPPAVALSGILSGREIAFFAAETAKEVRTALRLMEEFRIPRGIVVGGQEAGLAAADLARRGVPVVVGPLFHPQTRSPRRRGISEADLAAAAPPVHHHEAPFEFALRAEEEELCQGHDDCCAAGFPDFQPPEPLPSTATPILLHRAGVEFALGTGDTRPGETLLDYARFAARMGVPPEKALAAICGTPARMLGLETRVGLVQRGCDADILLFDGDPLLPTSALRAIISEGRTSSAPAVQE
jgi:imidazolonepropionase-like amidohydrolase